MQDATVDADVRRPRLPHVVTSRATDITRTDQRIRVHTSNEQSSVCPVYCAGGFEV